MIVFFVSDGRRCVALLLKVADPDKKLFQYTQVDFIKNEFALPLVAYQIGFLEDGEVA